MDLEKELREYLEYCQYRKELNAKTIKAYRIDLRQYFDFVGDEIFQRKRNEEFVTMLHKTFQQRTIKRKIASVKAFLRYLEDEEVFAESNPYRKIKVKFKETKSLPRVIPKNEIVKLLSFMYTALDKKGDRCSVLRDLSAVEMLFATGIRVYELSNLKAGNIDLTEGIIQIEGKGGKDRYVQIGNQQVLKLLQRYYIQNKGVIDTCGYFFINRDGKRLTEQSVRNMLKKYAQLSGITRNITPHMFRHSVATYLIEEGVDIVFVQKMLGHASIKTTQIYLHIASKMQMEILRVKHPRNNMQIGYDVNWNEAEF